MARVKKVIKAQEGTKLDLPAFGLVGARKFKMGSQEIDLDDKFTAELENELINSGTQGPQVTKIMQRIKNGEIQGIDEGGSFYGTNLGGAELDTTNKKITKGRKQEMLAIRDMQAVMPKVVAAMRNTRSRLDASLATENATAEAAMAANTPKPTTYSDRWEDIIKHGYQGKNPDAEYWNQLSMSAKIDTTGAGLGTWLDTFEDEWGDTTHTGMTQERYNYIRNNREAMRHDWDTMSKKWAEDGKISADETNEYFTKHGINFGGRLADRPKTAQEIAEEKDALDREAAAAVVVPPAAQAGIETATSDFGEVVEEPKRKDPTPMQILQGISGDSLTNSDGTPVEDGYELTAEDYADFASLGLDAVGLGFGTFGSGVGGSVVAGISGVLSTLTAAASDISRGTKSAGDMLVEHGSSLALDAATFIPGAGVGTQGLKVLNKVKRIAPALEFIGKMTKLGVGGAAAMKGGYDAVEFLKAVSEKDVKDLTVQDWKDLANALQLVMATVTGIKGRLGSKSKKGGSTTNNSNTTPEAPPANKGGNQGDNKRGKKDSKKEREVSAAEDEAYRQAEDSAAATAASATPPAGSKPPKAEGNKPETKTETKTETKAEQQPESKAETKAETEPKAKDKVATKPVEANVAEAAKEAAKAPNEVLEAARRKQEKHREYLRRQQEKKDIKRGKKQNITAASLKHGGILKAQGGIQFPKFGGWDKLSYNPKNTNSYNQTPTLTEFTGAQTSADRPYWMTPTVSRPETPQGEIVTAHTAPEVQEKSATMANLAKGILKPSNLRFATTLIGNKKLMDQVKKQPKPSMMDPVRFQRMKNIGTGAIQPELSSINASVNTTTPVTADAKLNTARQLAMNSQAGQHRQSLYGQLRQQNQQIDAQNQQIAQAEAGQNAQITAQNKAKMDAYRASIATNKQALTRSNFDAFSNKLLEEQRAQDAKKASIQALEDQQMASQANTEYQTSYEAFMRPYKTAAMAAGKDVMTYLSSLGATEKDAYQQGLRAIQQANQKSLMDKKLETIKSRKSGGKITLEEKAELERIKAGYKRALESDKAYYKRASETGKSHQKMLSLLDKDLKSTISNILKK